MWVSFAVLVLSGGFVVASIGLRNLSRANKALRERVEQLERRV